MGIKVNCEAGSVVWNVSPLPSHHTRRKQDEESNNKKLYGQLFCAFKRNATIKSWKQNFFIMFMLFCYFLGCSQSTTRSRWHMPESFPHLLREFHFHSKMLTIKKLSLVFCWCLLALHRGNIVVITSEAERKTFFIRTFIESNGPEAQIYNSCIRKYDRWHAVY